MTTTPLTLHLGELAESLHELQRRFRQAARVEVARAIGDALREFTQAMICGPVRYPATAPNAYSAWDDNLWQERGDAEPQFPGNYAEDLEENDEEAHGSLTVPPALMAGLAAARWGYLRTRQIGPALLIGLVVAIAAGAGGPTVKALLNAWATAQDLLNHPGPGPRP